MHVRRRLVVATLALALAATSGVSAAAPGGGAGERELPQAGFTAEQPPMAASPRTEARRPASADAGPAPRGPSSRELEATVGASLYVDVCDDAGGDAFDVRRTAVAKVTDGGEDFLGLTLRTCDEDALAGFDEQEVAWRVITATPPTGRSTAIHVTRNEAGDFVVERQIDSGSLLPAPDAQAWLARPVAGVEELVVLVPWSSIQTNASCDPAERSGCLLVQMASFDSRDGTIVDTMPDAGANEGAGPPLWPSQCRPDVDPASTDRARLTATSAGAAARVAARLHAAGYPVDVHDDLPVVEVTAGATDEVRDVLATWGEIAEIADPAVRQLARTPNDPHFDAQWYLPRINAPRAWDRETGSTGVTVAVVDNGVAAGRDDLDDGRVLAGWDALTGSSVPAGAHSDLGGHGTAVAALAAARTDEGRGIAGTAWKAGIVPVRVFDHAGCFVSEAAYKSALRWIADQPRGAIDVANFSLGGGRIPGEEELIRDMVANGTTVVAASGNEGDRTGAGASFPAALPEVIAVGATLRDDTLAAYSNRGRHVDVVAPGGLERSGATAKEAILAPADPVVVGPADPYAPLAGTSFATPLVSGVAALYLAEHPRATPADVTRALLTTARDLGEDLAGFDIAYGFGMADAAGVLDHEPGQVMARFDGLDRYETAARASQRAFRDPSLVDTVLLATGENYPDALAGGPLAARENAPILLTPRSGLHTATARELDRLLPDGGRVLVLGGAAAIDPFVDDQLRARNLQPIRIAGTERYATAASIAQGDGRGTWRSWGRSDLVYLATGENFPDALPGGAAAAAFDAPLLLTAQAFLPDATRQALEALGPSQVVVLGGPNAVSGAVVDELEHTLRISVVRAAGADRYETAVAALCPATYLCQTDTRFAVVATGEGFADALGGSAMAAALRAPLLLVPRAGALPGIVAEAMDVLEPEQAVVLGGPAAITREMADQVGARVVR